MQVTNSVVNPAQAQALSQAAVQPANSNNRTTPTNTGVSSTERTSEQNAQRPQTRFQVDERAIALLDAREQQRQQQNADVSNNALNSASINARNDGEILSGRLATQASSVQANGVNETSARSTSYDQPSRQNQTAVAAYQAIDNAAQRDDISQVFGVDLFA